MYILKIQGSGKVPDYIQLRDDELALIAYFKITNPKTALARCNLLHKMDEIIGAAMSLDFGKIQKLEL